MKLPGSSFYIRPVQPGEETNVLAVYRQCEDFLALGPAPANMEMVRADLALSQQEGGLFCGIYRRVDGELMGIIDFVAEGWRGDPSLAFLALLMIAAPHRACGLGAEVVRLVEADIMRSDRVRVIQSGVQVNNPGAIRFWQHMGYQIVSGAEAMPDGTTAYPLEKVISE